MKNNLSLPHGHYAGLCNELALLLRLSYPEIKHKYRYFPVYFINNHAKGVVERAIAIKFELEDFTVTCLFNDRQMCSVICFVPGSKEQAERVVTELNGIYKYNANQTKWMAADYIIRIGWLSEDPQDMGFLLYKL